MKWRYKVEIVRTLRDEGMSGHNPAELEERLNARAQEGWAFVQIMDVPTGWMVVYVSQNAMA